MITVYLVVINTVYIFSSRILFFKNKTIFTMCDPQTLLKSCDGTFFLFFFFFFSFLHFLSLPQFFLVCLGPTNTNLWQFLTIIQRLYILNWSSCGHPSGRHSGKYSSGRSTAYGTNKQWQSS